ncbi:hypothetical protein ACHAXT_011287 [Thalassiosira profunda]
MELYVPGEIMDDQPRADAAEAVATTLDSVNRQLGGMVGVYSTLARSVTIDDAAANADLQALGRISKELASMQRHWEGSIQLRNYAENYAERARSIDIGTITSSANVETLQRLWDNDSGLTKLVVGREVQRGLYEGIESAACYCPSTINEDLRWAGVFIGHNTNLRELVFCGHHSRGIFAAKSTADAFAELDNYLQFLSGVSHNTSIVSLEFNELTNGDIRAFFANNRNLRRVASFDCEFGGGGDWLLSSMLRGCQSLEDIRLTNNLGEGERPTTTIEALSTQTQLEYLALSVMNVGNAECRALAELPVISNLRTLNLSVNNIDDAGVEALVGAVANGNKLCSFDLSHNRSITTRGLQSLAVFLESSQCNLLRLSLLSSGVDDEGANILGMALANNRKLKFLELVVNYYSYCLITAQGWSALDDVLCNTSSVQATSQSNHILTSFSHENIAPSIGGESGAIPSSLVYSLEMNKRGAMEAARRKIIRHHLGSDEGMGYFVDMGPSALPHLLACVQLDELSLLYRFVRSLPSELGIVPAAETAQMGPQRKRKKTSGPTLCIESAKK